MLQHLDFTTSSLTRLTTAFFRPTTIISTLIYDQSYAKTCANCSARRSFWLFDRRMFVIPTKFQILKQNKFISQLSKTKYLQNGDRENSLLANRILIWSGSCLIIRFFEALLFFYWWLYIYWSFVDMDVNNKFVFIVYRIKILLWHDRHPTSLQNRLSGSEPFARWRNAWQRFLIGRATTEATDHRRRCETVTNKLC